MRAFPLLLVAFTFLLATPIAATAASDGRPTFAPISTGVLPGDTTENGPKAAFGGFDVVARFPQGVRDPKLGRIVEGNAVFAVTFKGAVFLFASAANAKAFDANPSWWLPPVGGYCLGAMAGQDAHSDGRLVTGFLQNAFYVPEFRTWAVYGSERGPLNWARMGSRARAAKFRLALEHYHRWTDE